MRRTVLVGKVLVIAGSPTCSMKSVWSGVIGRAGLVWGIIENFSIA
jgi:hypothetical protein